MKIRYAAYQANSNGENRPLGIASLPARPNHFDRHKIRTSFFCRDGPANAASDSLRQSLARPRLRPARSKDLKVALGAAPIG